MAKGFGGDPISSSAGAERRERALYAALEAPLDVFLVRKLGVPGREELATGANGALYEEFS
jgi:predicted phosphoribosyltransferase